MTPVPHPDTDPLPQILADHPELSGTFVVASQVDAVAAWPRIARHDGEVAIMLRRPGPEDETEWRDMLQVLRHLISSAPRSVRLLALSDAAATILAAELERPVDVVPRLPRRYNGPRRLTLCRADGAVVQLRTGDGALHPAGCYNLARLRRMARLEADGGDPDLADIAAFANGTETATPHADPCPCCDHRSAQWHGPGACHADAGGRRAASTA